MDNLISIIIPTYNRAHSLPEAIESVLEQSAGNWELIIIDDGSNDDTRNAIQDYLIDERVHYYFQKNAGVSAARNKGVELCQGDYIIFLDSDDRFLPGLFSRLDDINYKNYDLVCWQVSKQVDGKSSVLKPRKLDKIYNKIVATFLAGSICYRKEVIIEAGRFDHRISFGENYELGLRISQRKNLSIKIIDQQFLFYAIKSRERESISLVNRLESFQHLYDKHKRKYEKDRKSHGQIKYLLGYVHEKLGMRADAEKYYQSSFIIYPFNLKAFLKIIYFKLL